MDAGIKIDLDIIPSPVREVLARLEENNFRAYLVGGVVRDIIQGREPRDYDIATSAPPDKVCGLFPASVPTGLKHGTVTVIHGGLGIETTTLRRDGKYSDNRRPDSVEFTQSLREDLSRRDFTINSLAADGRGKVYDFFSGLKDMAEGIIKAVGKPGKRFREDALRMMRAVRFSCQLGFDIEYKTMESIRLNRRLIARVSTERIREELSDILLSPQPRKGLRLLFCSGLLEYILPELAEGAWVDGEDEKKAVFSQTLDMLENSPARLNVRLACLLHAVAQPGPNASGAVRSRNIRRRTGILEPTEEILARLKYDRRTIRSVAALVRECTSHPSGEKDIKKLLARVGEDNLEDLFDLWRAGSGTAGRPGAEDTVNNIEKKAQAILKQNLPLKVTDLAVDGNDLKSLGISPGREMGATLNRLLEVVLDKPEMNQKSLLLDLVQGWKRIRV